jgi:hypothetical protein
MSFVLMNRCEAAVNIVVAGSAHFWDPHARIVTDARGVPLAGRQSAEPHAATTFVSKMHTNRAAWGRVIGMIPRSHHPSRQAAPRQCTLLWPHDNLTAGKALFAQYLAVVDT